MDLTISIPISLLTCRTLSMKLLNWRNPMKHLFLNDALLG